MPLNLARETQRDSPSCFASTCLRERGRNLEGDQLLSAHIETSSPNLRDVPSPNKFGAFSAFIVLEIICICM